jgi:hypothetical protein
MAPHQWWSACVGVPPDGAVFVFCLLADSECRAGLPAAIALSWPTRHLTLRPQLTRRSPWRRRILRPKPSWDAAVCCDRRPGDRTKGRQQQNRQRYQLLHGGRPFSYLAPRHAVRLPTRRMCCPSQVIDIFDISGPGPEVKFAMPRPCASQRLVQPTRYQWHHWCWPG